MSAWDQVQEAVLIKLQLTEAESRVIEQIVLEHVRVCLQENQSPWDSLNEAMPDGYWNRNTPRDPMVMSDKEAEAIEDASGQMGLEPPNRMASRKKIMDPKVAQQVYVNLVQQKQKYAAALGGEQAYNLLLKKVGRELRDMHGLGQKQMGALVGEGAEDGGPIRMRRRTDKPGSVGKFMKGAAAAAALTFPFTDIANTESGWGDMHGPTVTQQQLEYPYGIDQSEFGALPNLGVIPMDQLTPDRPFNYKKTADDVAKMRAARRKR